MENKLDFSGHRFRLKNNKSFFFDSFGGAADKFLLKHLPKHLKYHNYKTHDKTIKLCGSESLNCFDLIERMN